MKTFAVAAIAATLSLGAFGAIADANAHTNVRIILGVPYYTYKAGPDFVFKPGHGWYRLHRVAPGNKLSCAQARAKVAKSFKVVAIRNCTGTNYSFKALKNGKVINVYINSRTGGVWRG